MTAKTMNATTANETTTWTLSAPLGAVRTVVTVLSSVADGIRAARECKTLTDRGVRPSEAVRDVFDRVRAD